MRRLIILIALLSLLSPPLGSQGFTLPLKPNSVRFAVIGDMGTGDKSQYETAQRMVEARQRFPFEFVIMVGDNIYGASSPADMQRKFEIPYKPLLDAGVKFYAALGNHDDVNERFYEHFNMGGKQYYTFKQANVRFFVLDSNYMSPEQQAWLANELKNSGSPWKIAYFHHPLYSAGGRHGSSLELRQLLEPLFQTYKVNVVFQGHDHVYERVKPQGGITYFTEGSSGQLRSGDLKRASFTDSGFDTDTTFMLVEIAGDEMYFQTITRTGRTVDSGVVVRGDKTQTATLAPPAAAATPPAAATAPETPAKPRTIEGTATPTTAPAASPETKEKPAATTTTAPPEKSATGAATSTAPPSNGSKSNGTAAQSLPATGGPASKSATSTTSKAQPAKGVVTKTKAAANKAAAKATAKKKTSRTAVAKKSKSKKTTAAVANKPRKIVVVPKTTD
ncbi:MAG TPA: metallophosphoesterase [Candidatus Acidoferrales bacterium]|jgi:predicted phosphodiesterase|nr:metallophosphoesterase [Candidatus Acidoferrales bacterium]